MSGQVQAILWAQFRTVRNYLPRTSLGAALVWLLGAAWYGLFVAIATGLAASLPHIPLKIFRAALRSCFFFLLFWQIFPLMTLSSGWSLDVRRLLVYPIRERTLFAIEVLLRITTAPETLIMLAGIIVGLMRHPRVPALSPLFLLLYLPFNLFLSLAIRETLLRFFQRRRFKELFAVFFLAIMLSPTLLANTSLGRRLAPVAFRLASSGGTPWFEISSLSLGRFSFLSIRYSCSGHSPLTCSPPPVCQRLAAGSLRFWSQHPAKDTKIRRQRQRRRFFSVGSATCSGIRQPLSSRRSFEPCCARRDFGCCSVWRVYLA